MKNNFCKHLRTKALFTGLTPEEAFADEQDGQAKPCNFWCGLTQTVIGADDRPVHKNICNPSRTCFEE